MKNKIILSAVFLFLISFQIACDSKKEEPKAATVDNEQIKKEIQDRENEFANIFNTKELKSIGYYADDAISYSQNKPPLVGRDKIIEYYKANMDSMPKTYQITFTTNEVFPSSEGNMVVEIGNYKLVDTETNTTINSGNYMSLFEKRNGKYVSIRDMSTSDME